MTLHFDLPADLEASARAKHADLEATAKEALLLELFRRGDITHAELAQGLGLDRFETDALLRRRGIFEGSYSSQDLEDDRIALERLLGHDAA